MKTLASLKASATAVPDQIKLYGIIAEAAVALQHVAESVSFRERAAPGATPSSIQIAKARMIARNLARDLDAFKEQR